MKKIHLEKIIARARRYIFGELLGQNSAKKIGDGYDFAQISAYHYGSSIRRIDAFSSAKKNQLHVRDFYESKDVNIHVVLCASGSFEFGTKVIKKEAIANIVALLGLSTVHDGENFSFSIVSDKLDFSIRAKKSKSYVTKAVEEVLQRDFKGKQISYKNLCNYLLKQRRSLLFIIGDFFEFPTLASVAKKHDIVAIKVRDSFENKPMFANFFDGVDLASMQKQELLFDKKNYEEYVKALAKHDNEIGEYFKKYGIKLVEVMSDEDVYKKIQKLSRGL